MVDDPPQLGGVHQPGQSGEVLLGLGADARDSFLHPGPHERHRAELLAADPEQRASVAAFEEHQLGAAVVGLLHRRATAGTAGLFGPIRQGDQRGIRIEALEDVGELSASSAGMSADCLTSNALQLSQASSADAADRSASQRLAATRAGTTAAESLTCRMLGCDCPASQLRPPGDDALEAPHVQTALPESRCRWTGSRRGPTRAWRTPSASAGCVSTNGSFRSPPGA